jgi:DNA-binding NtrC family response regulator
MNNTRILVVDDDQDMLDLAEYHLKAQGYQTVGAQTGERGVELFKENNFDVVLIDLQLPDISGIEVVKRLKELSPETEIIMISGHSSVSKAVEATKAGAFYFVEKPVEFEELMLLIEKALEHRVQAEEIKQLRGRLTNRTSYYNIIGGSKAMQEVYEIIDSIAETDANVLIIGESGTGKELIANAIHYKSPRGRRNFVKINCSALPKELIESELFGHTKGAFTGATVDKAGLLSRADGGSLLLDEISEMPVELQPKLLRVLQERAYYRLGGEKAQEANFRLISATNRNPADAIQSGHLREDLYYRISTIELHVPPLRQRKEDIQHLAEHFLEEFAEKYQRPKCSISGQNYERMFQYSWPGNVRELQNVLERAVLLCKGRTIEVEDLALEQVPQKFTVAAAPLEGTEVRNQPATAEDSHGRFTYDEIGRIIIDLASKPSPEDGSTDVFGHIERAVVGAALKHTGGNKQAAAKLLGVYRPRLYTLIKKHKLLNPPVSAAKSQPPAVSSQDGGKDQTSSDEIGMTWSAVSH